MKFGTYFAYWEREWKADYVKYVKKVAALGFDVLEISAANFPVLKKQDLSDLKSCAKDNNILLTSCIGLPRKCNTASLNEKTRERGIAYLKKLIDVMDEVDSRILGGITYAYWPADYTKPMDKETERKQSIKSMREIADYAAGCGVTLALETVNRFEHYLINDAVEAVRFVKDIKKDNVKVMLDSFHMNIEEDSFSNAIKHTGRFLGHFHVGEANRKVPGKGRLPWKEIGQALNVISYDGCVVMEPFVKMGGVVGRDIRVWRDLSDKANQKKMDDDIAQSLRFLRAIFKKDKSAK
jgi:D-psicose/D-tagatose/L-ribulose 3-epimerase